jgi:hypothetical protein
MSVLRKLWGRITEKKAVTPKIEPLPLKNKVYSSNQNILAEIKPRGPKRYDTVEEALRHRHTVSSSPFYKGIPVKPLLDAQAEEMIRKFKQQHMGASNAHRVMVVPDIHIDEPSYTIEEALKVRNNPDHPINRTFIRVPKPSLGEAESF